jgi:O-antigen ligase
MEKNQSDPLRFYNYLPLAVMCVMLFIAPIAPDIKLVRPKLLVLQTGLFGAVVLWCIISATRGALIVRKGWTLLPIAVYAVLGALFYQLSPDKPVALTEFNRCVVSLCAYVAALHLIRSPAQTRWCLGSWLTGTFLAAVYGILQHSGGVGFIGVPHMDRVMSTFGNPIFFAAHLVISLPVALGLLADMSDHGSHGKDFQGTKYFITRMALAVFLFVGLWALLLTKTRGAYLGFSVAILTFVVLRVYHRTPHAADGKRVQHNQGASMAMSRIRLGLSVGGAVVVVGIFAYATRAIWSRQQAHLLIWRDTVSMWTTHPWFGIGTGTFHLYFPQFASDALKSIWPQGQCIVNDAHNEFLQIMVETGIIGIGVFLWLLATFFFSQTRTNHGRRAMIDGMVAGAAGLLAQNMVSVDMRFIISSVYLFTVFGMVDGFSAQDREISLSRIGQKLALIIGAGLVGYYLFSLALSPYIAQKKYAATPDFFDQKVLEPARTVADLEALAIKYPDQPSIFEKIGWIYAKEKKWELAIKNYQAAQRMSPQTPGPYNNLGNIYFLTGNRPAAIACWQQSLIVAPGQLDSRLNLATAFYYQGRLKEAADELKEVLKIDPHNEKAIVLLKQMTE